MLRLLWVSHSWTSTPDGKSGRNELVNEVFPVFQSFLHLVRGKLSGFYCLRSIFEDKLESLIQLIFNLLAVFDIFRWILLKVPLLLFTILLRVSFKVLAPNNSRLSQWKFVPPGPANFWAKPAVTHVGDLTHV